MRLSKVKGGKKYAESNKKKRSFQGGCVSGTAAYSVVWVRDNGQRTDHIQK